MTYIQGFLIPVPNGRRDDYLALAAQTAPLFQEFGGTRIVETWGDEVPDGKVTDLRRAVQAAADENVVFSWIEYPDKVAVDAAHEKMQTDERMKRPPDLPFDGARMIFGGFDAIIDEGSGGRIGYVDGFVAAVPTANRDRYVAHARTAGAVFRREGATRMVEGWGVDVPEGKATDFRRAVAATADETIVFSWIEWPDKATRDAGMAAMMNDPAIAAMDVPFDASRVIYGGFTAILDTDEA